MVSKLTIGWHAKATAVSAIDFIGIGARVQLNKIKFKKEEEERNNN